ncbi:MAG: hypothetical protein ACRCVI_03105 [Mycoplasmoidaceae bacterium]
MRKKTLKIITSLSLLSALGIGLLNSNIYNPQINSEIKNADVLENVDSRVYPENYKSVYQNRFNTPVISFDQTHPGFLGVIQPVYGTTDFPTQITWTGNNLFNSWGQDVTKHPDILKYKGTGSEFIRPIVVGAYHLDREYTTSNFVNQIVIVVGDQNNLQARKYAFVRYNTITGDPVVNPDNESVIAPATTNSPIPSVNNQGVFTFANLWGDNLVYYPGTYGQIKNDMFMFTITNDKLVFHANSSDKFAGIRNWPNGGSNPLYNDNNYLMAIYGLIGISNWFLLFHADPNQENFGGKFSVLKLERDFGPFPNWVDISNYAWVRGNTAVTGITDADGTFQISNRATFVDYFQPLLYSNGSKNVNVNLSSLVVFKIENNFYYTRMALNIAGSNSINNQNANKYISIPNLLTTSGADANLRYRPVSWVNQVNHDHATITYQTSDASTWYTMKFVFRNTTAIGFGELLSTSYDLQRNNYTTFTKQPWNSITIEDYFNTDVYIFSGATNLTHAAYIPNATSNVDILSTLAGGLSFKNPLISAQANNFLIGQSNAKTPSQLNLAQGDTGSLMYNGPLSSSISDGGWSQKYLLNRNTSNLDLSTGSFASIPLSIQDNLQRNDTAGIIEGNVRLTLSPSISGQTFNFVSQFNLRLDNLKTDAQPTVLVVNDQEIIRETYASSITTTNVTNYFSLNNLPIAVTPDQLQWQVLEPNNRTGFLRIQVTTPQYIDLDTSLKIEPKTFELTLNGINLNGLTFKQITGTILKRNNQPLDDLTIWEVDANTISSFIEIENIVPGQTVNATYSLDNFQPLLGSLRVKASVTGGYFSGANALPTTTPNVPLNLEITIDSFKKIPAGGTSYQELAADNTVTPYIFEADPQLLLPYIRIINQVPGSVVTVSNAKASENGSLTATVNSNKVYDSSGNIVPGTPFSLTYSGFKEGTAIVGTQIDAIANTNEAAKMFAIELNQSNITKFVTMINLPSGAKVEYKILSTNNISASPNGGSARVSAVVDKYINEQGEIVNSSQEFPLRNPISGFQSVLQPTSVEPTTGNANVYPQFFDPLNAEQFLVIKNGSQVLGKATSIEIIASSSSYDNLTGRLTFSYRKTNFFNAAGAFITTPDTDLAVINGFKRVSGPTTLTSKTGAPKLNEILPSEFNASNWADYFVISHRADNTIIPPDGPIVSKISENDETGEMTLRIEGLLNFVNSENIITPSGTIDVVIKGLKVTPTDNSLMFTIIGSSIGGVIIIVLLIGIIVWMRINKKNKELLNTKKAPSSGTGPTSGPRPPVGPSIPNQGTAARAVPPAGSRPPVGPPPMAGPTMARAVPPVGPTPPPMGAPSGRPTPPPRK